MIKKDSAVGGNEDRKTCAAADKPFTVRQDGATSNVFELDGAGKLLAKGGLLPARPGALLAAAVNAFFGAGGAPGTLTTGADTAPVSGTIYLVPLVIPFNATLTGLGFLIGTVGGTDKVIVSLYDDTGAKVANSALAGTDVGGVAATMQEVPFTAPYSAKGPGLYYAAISFNGNTARFRASVLNGARGQSQVGVFATLDAITAVPVVAGAAPLLYAY